MHHVPGDLFYTPNHIWLEHIGEGKYRAGITDFAQEELGDVVFVEAPEMDRSFEQEEECAVVESVKSTSDIFCPVSGNIIAVNVALEDSPEIINSDPYGDGWIFVIAIDDEGELEELLDAEAYTQLTEEE